MDMIVRLLVHAGASSTRQDDDQRVVQVAAYLDLECTVPSRTHVVCRPDRSETSQYRNPGINNAPLQDSTSNELDSTVFIDDTQLAYTSLESQLFPSSARTVPTPAKRRICELQISSTAPAPSKALRLSVSPVPRPQFPEQQGCINIIHDDAEQHPVLNTGQAAPAQRQSPQSKPKERTQSTEGTITTDDTTSELPTSYSLGDVGDGSNKRPQLSERSISDPGPNSTKRDISHGVSVQAQDQDIPLRGMQGPSKTILGQTALRKPVAHEARTTRNLGERVAAKDLLLQIESFPQNLSTSIRPAGPLTTLEPFITHITHALRKLEQNTELSSSTFLPATIGRSLDIHERGHWEVPCSHWAPELQKSFWKTLEMVVGSGKAGWGVWCTREPEVSLCSQSSQQRGERMENPTASSFGPVRVYCWGEIAKHIYLLLYVASSSKVRKLGLRWIDAQGLVVLQMRTG